MDKKISELDQALQINNDAVFPISQDNGGTDTTYKVSITQISAEVGEDQTFSNLDTTDKTLVGAINEIAQGGGGGGSSTLAGLSDVDIDDQTLSDGQVLKYDSAEDKWINDDVGAGGHTIVADDGTDLTQRANLQFIGAYSEDNSIDDTTEVNVVRNMTKAQFDLLTADEKTGFINTTDETSQIYATEIPVSTLDSDTVAEKLDEKVDTNSLPVYITQKTGSSIQFLVDCSLGYYYADQWLGRVPFPFVAKNINYSITIDDVVADNIGNITAKCSVNGKSQSYFEMITTRTMPSLPDMFSVCGARCRFTITFN